MANAVSKATQKFHISKAKHSTNQKNVLAQLKSYLNAAAPEPVFFLTRLWNDQQKAVTYKELREAIQNGFLDEKTLQDWQMDYANFVETSLKSIWHQAMEAANSELVAKHPDYFFDPFADPVRKWTTEHGAQWVTAIADEQREAIAIMLDKSFIGDFTVDELSRAIRPVIGLNHIQAKANINYYKNMKVNLLKNNPSMKEATAEKRARDASLRYAARQHRQRAFTIATTEMAFAYNKGAHEGIIQAQQQNMIGKVQKIWSTADDERVCAICGALDNTVREMEDDFEFKGQALYSGQKRIPPAHPRCRCAIAYDEVEPPQYQAEPEPDPIQSWDPADQTQLQAGASLPPPALPSLKTPKGLQHNGKIHLGGTGEMHSYLDADGQEWIFKPAQNKGGVIEPFRAYVQETAFKVQHIIDPDTAIPVKLMTMGAEVGNKFGALQKRITLGQGQPNLKSWQNTSDQLPSEIKQQIQREHVTDWLLANYDSHGGNFIIDDAAHVIGVDKEQAFRYISNAATRKMSLTYHPNAYYGETEPIYNTIFRRFAKGEIDLNLQDTLTHIKRIEAISDVTYRGVFKQYAIGLHGKGQKAEELLDQIVERKAAIRETYREFYGELIEQRTGIKKAFVWADEMAGPTQQPLAAVMHTKDTLGKMSIAELKQLAKTKQIPYFLNMNKIQLVESIADPVAAVQMSAQVKAKLAANATARQAAQQTPAAPTLKTTNQMMQVEDVFEDLSVIPDNRLGISIIADKYKLEGFNMTARRINIDGVEFYEVTGKLTGDAWRGAAKKASTGGSSKHLSFEQADNATRNFQGTSKIGFSTEAYEKYDGDARFEIVSPSGSQTQRGLGGFFRVRTPVSIDGRQDAQNIKNLMQQVGLDELTINVDRESFENMKKIRLLWQHAPDRILDVSGTAPRDLPAKLSILLQEEKISIARLQKLKMGNVFDGYSTLIEEGISKEYVQDGARFMFAGISERDSVVAIIKSKGLMSTNKRVTQGFMGNGASMSADVDSGGSDSVFVRLSTKSSQGTQYRTSYRAENYRILVDPSEMDRTDWYAYNFDNYGTTRESVFNQRTSVRAFLKDVQQNYSESNEMMFRHGIRREKFVGISCETGYLRDELLRGLKAENITEVNGIPIEKFVKVSTRQ